MTLNCDFEALSNDFYKLYTSRAYSDVVVKCRDHRFNAHRAVLSSRSPVFKAALRKNWKENAENIIDITGVGSSGDPVAVSMMLQYIYRADYDAGRDPYDRIDLPEEVQDSQDDTTPETMESGLLTLHANVYLLGDKYDDQKLTWKALEQFDIEAAQLDWDETAVCEVMDIVLGHPTVDNQLRRALYKLISERGNDSTMATLEEQVKEAGLSAEWKLYRVEHGLSPPNCPKCGPVEERECTANTTMAIFHGIAPHQICGQSFAACACSGLTDFCQSCEARLRDGKAGPRDLQTDMSDRSE